MRALKTYLIVSLLSCTIAARAGSEDSAAKHHFVQAAESLQAMLEGKERASYEEAIYILENAWWEGQIDQASFTATIDHHSGAIKALMEHYRDSVMMNQPGDLLRTKEEKRSIYEKALANFAIYTYMTSYKAFTYAAADPLGTIDWTNTQVSHLLNEGNGNCFALASLFKILSDRLGSGASLCTAPGHIYIRHADDKGIYHNVELSTRSFPGTGTIETLTHTPSEAVKSGIALRELDRQQSLALCLVYLAKGYSRKFSITGDQFMLDYAELALVHDPRNLNAMLLKAEVLEQRLLNQDKDIAQLSRQKDFREYQSWITRIFKLGYREMPFDMKNILVKGWMRDTLIDLKAKEHIPSRLKHKTLKDTRYASLSWGLFDEQIRTKPLERYGRTVFDTKQRTIIGFVEEDRLYNNYEFDPVVFAWNVDPLAHKFPFQSPYAAFDNSPIWKNDPTGAAADPSTDVTKNKDGTMTVVGGRADGDRNIYVVNNARDKKRTGEVIGKSQTEYSFLNDAGRPVVGAVIDPNDRSGEDFLNNDVIGASPTSITYAWGAKNGGPYDFKDIGIEHRPLGMRRSTYRYRGMPLGGVQGLNTEENVPIFGSGRDVGNIGAGYIVGRAGLSWSSARMLFDAYQSRSVIIDQVESLVSQLAELAGWNMGSNAYRLSVQEMIKETGQSPFQK